MMLIKKNECKSICCIYFWEVDATNWLVRGKNSTKNFRVLNYVVECILFEASSLLGMTFVDPSPLVVKFQTNFGPFYEAFDALEDF